MPLSPREQIEQAALDHEWEVTESNAARMELRWRSMSPVRYHMLVEFGAAGQLVSGLLGGPGGIPLPGLHHDSVLAGVLDQLERVATSGRRRFAQNAQ